MGIMPDRFNTTSKPDVVVTGVTVGTSETVAHRCYRNPCQVCGRSFTIAPPSVGAAAHKPRCATCGEDWPCAGARGNGWVTEADRQKDTMRSEEGE